MRRKSSTGIENICVSISLFFLKMWPGQSYDPIYRGQRSKPACAFGHPFAVDSADSFDMGGTAGRFAYLEDFDGTLIELVETHKVPIFKLLGIYIDLKKRHSEKPLPKWLVKMMRVHQVGR